MVTYYSPREINPVPTGLMRSWWATSVSICLSGLAGFARLCAGDQYEVNPCFSFHSHWLSLDRQDICFEVCWLNKQCKKAWSTMRPCTAAPVHPTPHPLQMANWNFYSIHLGCLTFLSCNFFFRVCAQSSAGPRGSMSHCKFSIICVCSESELVKMFSYSFL